LAIHSGWVMNMIRRQVLRTSRRLLSEQNRDPYTSSFGCFDRRYWSWKLADYPEATFQRNVYPLAWLIKNAAPELEVEEEILSEAVQAGLSFAARIQHSDGSFDQAFPNEHSFGATAFLLHSLLEAYRIVQEAGSAEFRNQIERSLMRAADFLCRHEERHGRIANHLAGASLSMLASGHYFDEPRYKERARSLLEQILDCQSPEGWFWEYDGADPGYQSLCLYYLAKIHLLHPDGQLRSKLGKAIDFLSWFVHPDGTFGGEYGSRRTAIFYPGGLAVLASEIPLARSLIRFMLTSIAEGRTVTPDDVDLGNFAPIMENYIPVLEKGESLYEGESPPLPCHLDGILRDFPHAKLHARGTTRYYAIVGVSNGGVMKVFDRHDEKLIWNDAGYVGQMMDGHYITSQMTSLERTYTVTPEEICFETSFYSMRRTAPTPARFLILRFLNLTLMRSLRLGNFIKRLLVKFFISSKQTVPLKLIRKIRFTEKNITVTDKIEGKLSLRWLEYGRPFTAIHMASARYFEGEAGSFSAKSIRVDASVLPDAGQIHCQAII
jgi:hypothetical protein